jgi:Bacterial archaeo-eukaryotic release factor family 7
MQLLSKDDLKTLMAVQGDRCVSIYLSTHRLGIETRQDPIQLRNLLREATERLIADGLHTHEVEVLLEGVQDLLGDGFVWRHLGEGMALFVSPHVFRYYCLPRAFAPLVVVGRRFHTKPLLPLLGEIEGFYVLALSQHAVRLFRGTRYDLSEVSLEHVPHQLAEAIQPNGQEQTLQFHTAGPVGRGQWASVFYGSGGGAADAKSRLLQFCHEVQQGVIDRLRGEDAPLVLAGVDYLLALYREVNRYPHLADQEIAGNPERLRLEDLRAQAWAIGQPHFRRKLIESVAQYQQLSSGPRSSDRLRAIVPAACRGQVGLLFVAEGREQWGTFDPASSLLEVHPNRQVEDEELLDLTAAYTVLAGGTVYAIPPDQMPTESPLAALFRY